MGGHSVVVMQRRDFLRILGAASLAPTVNARARAASPAAMVLYDDRSIALDRVGRDPKHVADALWVRKTDLTRINGFEIKPQGACRADLCIPIPKDMRRGEYFNLTAFAKKAGQPVVADVGARVWSLGEMQALGGGFGGSRIAPDFTAPDRAGRPVHLSQFRGKKVLVVTWASW
jgi:hypothetical protein